MESTKEETKRPSIKKGIPKPEEPVDEMSKVKLSKTPTKPSEEKLEEAQTAKSKKPIKKVLLNVLLKLNVIHYK